MNGCTIIATQTKLLYADPCHPRLYICTHLLLHPEFHKQQGLASLTMTGVSNDDWRHKVHNTTPWKTRTSGKLQNVWIVSGLHVESNFHYIYICIYTAFPLYMSFMSTFITWLSLESWVSSHIGKLPLSWTVYRCRENETDSKPCLSVIKLCPASHFVQRLSFVRSWKSEMCPDCGLVLAFYDQKPERIKQLWLITSWSFEFP